MNYECMIPCFGRIVDMMGLFVDFSHRPIIGDVHWHRFCNHTR